MNNLWKHAVIIFGLVFVITLQSCNDDESPTNPPELILSSPDLVEGEYTTDDSGEVEISVTVNAPNGFNVLRISYSGISLDTEEYPRTETGQTSFNLDYKIENIQYGSSGSFTITFQAVDDTDQTTEQVVTVIPEGPTVELTEDNRNVQDGALNAEVNSTFSLNYRYTFPSGFGQFKIVLDIGGATSETLVTELPPTQGLGVTDAIIHAFSEDDLGKTISYTLEIVDALGNNAQLEVPVNLTIPPAKKFTAILLAAPTDNKDSKSFFSTNIGETYSVNDVKNASNNIAKEIDFGYYYGVTDMASLAGPANYPTDVYNLGPNGEDWPTLNVANFKRTDMTVEQFDDLTEDSQSEIDAAFDNAPGEAQLIITDLQEGEVVSFKTDMKNNKRPKGLIKVVKITGTIGSEASIEIEVITNQ